MSAELQSSMCKIIEALKQAEIKKATMLDAQIRTTSMQDENLRLKERHIYHESKIEELEARLEGLSSHYKSCVSAGTDMKNIQEKLLKDAPKQLEEENATLADTIAQMEVTIFHTELEKRKKAEKWKVHKQKIERLVELMAQVMGRLGSLEKQIVIANNTCKKLKPTARLLAKRTMNLRQAQEHSRCRLRELSGLAAGLNRKLADSQAELLASRARLSALEGEVAGLRAAMRDQRLEAEIWKSQVTALQATVDSLEAKLSEAQEIIRDQSALLARPYEDISA